jgi:hypothetical protein
MIAKLQSRFGPIGWDELQGFALRLSAAVTLAGVGFILGARVAAMPSVSYSLAKILDFTIPTAFGLCSFIMAAFLVRLIDVRFFLPGRERRSLFFERNA